jgi:hypothetical protein
VTALPEPAAQPRDLPGPDWPWFHQRFGHAAVLELAWRPPARDIVGVCTTSEPLPQPPAVAGQALGPTLAFG